MWEELEPSMGYSFKKKKQYTLHDKKMLLTIFHAELANVSFMGDTTGSFYGF